MWRDDLFCGSWGAPNSTPTHPRKCFTAINNVSSGELTVLCAIRLPYTCLDCLVYHMTVLHMPWLSYMLYGCLVQDLFCDRWGAPDSTPRSWSLTVGISACQPQLTKHNLSWYKTCPVGSRSWCKACTG